MIEPLTPGSRGGARSVSQLVRELGETLASRFGALAVQGEISGFSRASSGHCYFNLKDADGGGAAIRCAMFRRAAIMLDFAPGDGQLVEVRGRIGIYEQRGELQFVVEAMQRAGAGALFERFLRLRAQLEAQGLFDAARKREIAVHPRKVGVVTSLGGAALHDVLSALARRAPHVEVIVYPSLVQGAEAPAALCEAIDTASRRAEVQTLILCRGGGSLEDLWAFNDERVVRAIVACAVPVICGVGHETDVTLSDLAADLRAPTPTAAAELAAPVRREALARLAAHAAALSERMRRLMDGHAQSLDRASMRLLRPAQRVSEHRQRLALLARRAHLAIRRPLERAQTELPRVGVHVQRACAMSLATHGQRAVVLEGRLRALDPTRVLQRGYAWIADSSGGAVMSVRGMRVGSQLTAVLADGKADVTVTNIEPAGVAVAGVKATGIEALQAQPEQS